MPYNPNANWTAKVAARAQSPTYYVVIDGLTTAHYSTAPVRSPSVTKKLYLNTPASIGQKVSQLQGRTSLNLFALELVNKGNEINDLFATEKSSPTLPTLINRRVTLYSGYADLVEADYAPWAKAQIRSVRARQEGTLWEFGLTDLRRAQQETIAIHADARGSQINLAFTQDYAAGVGVFKTNGDPSAWRQYDRLFLGPSTDAANPGAEEKVTVQQVRDTTNEVFIDPVTVYKYKSGDRVRAASMRLVGNPYNIMLAILTGDFDNVSWPLDEALGMPTGLDIAAGDIDTTGILKERDRTYPSSVWGIEITKPATGTRVLESFLFRWLGYPRILLSGKIGFRAFRPVYPDDVAAGLATLTEADIIDWEASRAIDDHVNRVVLGVDSAFGGGSPAQLVTLEETADQATTLEEAEIREESTGFLGSQSGARLAQGRASVALRRFVDGPYQIRVRAHATKRALEVGEDLLLTHSRMPNPASSTPGLSSQRVEIVERNEDLVSGRVELVLQDPNFTRPAWIGASGAVPGYDSASANEREYAYIGPSGSPVGNFSDGTPPYEIQ